MITLFSSTAGILFVVSFLSIIIQLKKWQKHSLTDMRHNPMWPLIIFEYKKHTKEKFGKVGTLYYVTLISGFCLVLSLLFELLLWIISHQ
jgi:hypothetical protein